MKCDKAPPGWRCKLETGHTGPCAAVPTGFLHRLFWRIRFRTWNLGD